MNKQQLANKIWESANKLRSKIEANEYKDYILGFIFYKYLSDRELKFARENGFAEENIRALSEDDAETVKYIRENIGYFIAYKDLFSTWIQMKKDFDVANVRDALSAFSRLINETHKKVFCNIFRTLETGLSKLGENSASQTKSISSLLQLIKDIPMDGRQDYDVLGFIYEYLISMFAANAGKKAGEFYTPHEVSLFMSEIVAHHFKDRKEIKIYDPTSGSGSLLINIGRSVARHMDNANNIQYYAQELKENTYNLTRMNLVMRGILPSNIIPRNGDTLEADWPYFDESSPTETYNPLYVDAVVSNPPYSQHWDPADKETDPRFANFGLAPKSKADYAFLLHDLYHLKPNGIMTIVLPHGVLFRGDSEGEIRKNLIENNHIDAIIGLPPNIFFGTGIPTIVMVLKQKRANTDTLIIDASAGFVKEGKNNRLRASDIKKIVDAVTGRLTVDGYSRSVTRDEIRRNEYNLNIPRYVTSSQGTEHWDIYATMFGGIPDREIDELGEYWRALPGLREALFVQTGHYAQLAAENIEKVVNSNASVQKFKNSFSHAFAGFGDYLKRQLLDRMNDLNVNQEEAVLSGDIFSRIQTLPLLDKYKAYQLLDDEWTKIAVDLEIIQTEGFAATKQVDPNMVIRKKDGRDEEVQDGWAGHVIPFELTQQTLLKKQYDALRQKETRLTGIAGELEAVVESLDEEGKELLNDGNTAFDSKLLAAYVKDLRGQSGFDEESLEAKALAAQKLLTEEKELKRQLKQESAALHQKTKATIEALSDDQVYDLLEKKWIQPMVANLDRMPVAVLNDLTAKIKALSVKYAVTLSDVETQIRETEHSLAAMLDELTGGEDDMKGIAEFKRLLGAE